MIDTRTSRLLIAQRQEQHMLEWLIPTLADNVLGYVLDQSGLGEKLREKLKPDATKIALQNALKATFGHFQQKYPHLMKELFIDGLLDTEREVRIGCVQALERLGQRFPAIIHIIEGKLIQAIIPSQFKKLDNGSIDEPDIEECPAYDYAY